MKKLVKFLVPFLCVSASVFSACGKDNKIMLSFGDMHVSDVDEITVSDIQDRVTNKESFILAVSSNTCACWTTFHPIIKNYIVDNHLYCAHIKYNDFKDVSSNYGIVLSSSSITFIIFDKGEAKIKIISKADDKRFTDSKVFESYMNGVIKMPKMYLINEDDIKNIKSSGKNSLIYFERTGCGDCTYINKTLFEYFETHKNSKEMYVLDCQPWKLLDSDQYQAKKDEFGLSSVNNPVYGANIGSTSGVFPFFSYISNGDYASGAVAFNDTVAKVDGKYVVTDSYYTSERVSNLDYTDKVVKGMEIPESDVSDNTEYVTWDRDKAINIYKPIITSYLDSKLPLTNFKF